MKLLAAPAYVAAALTSDSQISQKRLSLQCVFCIPIRGTKVPSSPDWLHEIKYDGYRLRVERSSERVRLITRNGHDWTDRYPWIVEAALKNRIKQFVIDGEAVVLGVDGVPDFKAPHSRKHDEEVQLYAFDILTLDGEDLRILTRLAFPVTRRRALASRDERSYFLCACVDLRAICLGELPVKTAETKAPDARISRTVWLAGLAVRTIFIAILIVITARVASPQLEHIWSLWETPSDLVRVALGVSVCGWLLVHIFILPKDPSGYRTWLYLGLAILPLSVLCAVVIW
jgi:hypothetical protein